MDGFEFFGEEVGGSKTQYLKIFGEKVVISFGWESFVWLLLTQCDESTQ